MTSKLTREELEQKVEELEQHNKDRKRHEEYQRQDKILAQTKWPQWCYACGMQLNSGRKVEIGRGANYYCYNCSFSLL